MDSFDFNRELYKKDWRWQEGDLTVTRSTQWSAPGCHCGCSILLYTDADGRLVKVEGDPQSGMTNGRLCMRCFDLVNQVYHPDRVLYPMKRAKENRGKDAWERISWDEAYDLIEKRAHEIQEEFGARSIICTQGTGRNIMWVTRFLAYQVFDTPNIVSGFLSGDSCYVPRVVATQMLTGGQCVADFSQFFEDHFDNPEYRVPDTIVIWGSNTLVSSSDGMYAPLLSDCIKRGSKLIVIDPRVTWMGAKADIMLQLRPGTDGALALGIINIIISEDLYDHEFVDKWTYGFDALAERAADYPVEKVAEICGISEDKIIAAARMWANSPTAALQWGLALDQQVDGVGAAHGVMCIEGLTGNIEKPGGMILATKGLHVDHPYDINDWTFQAFDIPPMGEDRIGFGVYPLRSNPNNGGLACSDVLIEQLETGDPFPVKMCVSFANDWLTCMAGDQNRVAKAMENVDFVVVGDVFMTPTAQTFGDLFLPVAMGPERDGLRDWFVPVRAITKVTQTGEAKSDDQIAFELFRRMHPERCPWNDHLEMTEFFISEVNLLNGDPDIDGRTLHLDELREEVTIYPKRTYNRHERGELRLDGGLGFETPTGRLEFYSYAYERMGFDPLPWYKEPVRGPISTPELMEEYPFVLTTGRRSWEFFHSEHRNSKMMREFHPDPIFEIHPDDARKYGIESGDWVWLENQFGRAKFRADVTEGMKRGVISAEHAWWFPERSPEDQDGEGCFAVYESNANQLTSMGECGPSSYGSPYKSQICKIYKAD